MAQNHSSRPFITLDLYLAAYHSLHGAEVTLKMETSKVAFVIPRDGNFYEVQDQYHDNSGVPIIDFTNEVKMMRSRMYEVRFANETKKGEVKDHG
jgi:hypothetical protein